MSARAPGVPDVAQVLARVRVAVGYERLRRYENGILIREILEQHGGRTRCSLMSAPDGRYVESFEAGMTRALGFDGNRYWAVDHSDEVDILVDTEHPWLRAYHLTTWLRAGHWLADQGDMELSIVKGHTNAQRVTLSAKLAGNTTEQWLLIDRSTWLPSAICQPNLLEEPLWRFEDYRSTLGVRLPHRLTAQSSGQDTSVILIRKVEEVPQSDRNRYSPPEPPDNTQFVSSLSPKVDFRLSESGHLLVRPRINNQRADWFVLDSGTNFMAIVPKIGDTLGMTTLDKFTAQVSGENVLTASVQARKLRLGRLVISNATFVELPLLDFMKSIGVEASGILGYDVLRRAVIELDISQASLKIYDPETYQAKGVAWQECVYHNRLICVRCRFEGDRDALFIVDTGSYDTVSFSAPTVEHFNLLDGRETTPLIVMDQDRFIGTGKEGTIAWFEIAGHRIDNPNAVFSPPETGERPYDDPHRYADLIGLGLLRHFKVIFDYPHKRIAFVKLDDKQPTSSPTTGKAEGAPEIHEADDDAGATSLLPPPRPSRRPTTP